MFLAFHCVVLLVTEFIGGDFKIVFTHLFIVLSHFLFEWHILNQWPFSKWPWCDGMSSWWEWGSSVMVWIAELCNQTWSVDTSPLDMLHQKENKKRKGKKGYLQGQGHWVFHLRMIFVSYLRNHNCWTSRVSPWVLCFWYLHCANRIDVFTKKSGRSQWLWSASLPSISSESVLFGTWRSAST